MYYHFLCENHKNIDCAGDSCLRRKNKKLRREFILSLAFKIILFVKTRERVASFWYNNKFDPK